MKSYLLIPFILFALQVASVEEQIPSLPQLDSTPLLTPIMQEEKFLYGSLSLIPGVGISSRTRTGSKGTAIDCKLGVLFIPFDTLHGFPVITADYNFLYFFRADQEFSPYVSYGIGAAYIIPYIPLRAGLQYKYGFIDIGSKMVLGFLPSPEIRAGVGLKF